MQCKWGHRCVTDTFIQTFRDTHLISISFLCDSYAWSLCWIYMPEHTTLPAELQEHYFYFTWRIGFNSSSHFSPHNTFVPMAGLNHTLLNPRNQNRFYVIQEKTTAHSISVSGLGRSTWLPLTLTAAPHPLKSKYLGRKVSRILMLKFSLLVFVLTPHHAWFCLFVGLEPVSNISVHPQSESSVLIVWKSLVSSRVVGYVLEWRSLSKTHAAQLYFTLLNKNQSSTVVTGIIKRTKINKNMKKACILKAQRSLIV